MLDSAELMGLYTLARSLVRKLDGLAAALKVVSLHANGPEWARATFGEAPIGRLANSTATWP